MSELTEDLEDAMIDALYHPDQSDLDEEIMEYEFYGLEGDLERADMC